MTTTSPSEPEDNSPKGKDLSPTTEESNPILNPIVCEPLGRGVLRFGLPLVVAMALQATFNLVDIIIIGQLPNGTLAIGALTICDQVAMVAAIVANGISNASVAIIARRHAEGNQRAASLCTAQSLSVVLGLSVFFGLIGVLFADPLSGDLLGAKGDVHTMATEYMRVIVGGSFSVLILFQITAILRAVGDASTPMYLLIGSNVLNLILTPVMAYEPGQGPEFLHWAGELGHTLGIGGMGVTGAAWSTVLARTLAIGIGIFALIKTPHLKFKLRSLVPNKRECMRILRIAWPSCSQFGLRVGVVLFFTGIVAHLFTTETDATVLSAFGICVRLDTVALFTGMGWGASASAYVGQNLGAGKQVRARHAAWLATAYNAVLMLGVYGVYMLIGEDLIAVVDDDPKVIATAMSYLTIVGSTYALLGVAVVMSQALAGAGATLSSLVLDVIVLLLIQVPVTIVITTGWELEPNGVFWLIALGNLLSAIVYIAWCQRGTWVHKKV